MRNTLTHLLIAGLVVLSVSAFGAEHPELKAFPAAKQGLERFVIVLPEKERGAEDAFRVEIIVGKEMLTDGVNLVRLANTTLKHGCWKGGDTLTTKGPDPPRPWAP